MNEYQIENHGTRVYVSVNCNCDYIASLLTLAIKAFLDAFKIFPRELPEGLC